MRTLKEEFNEYLKNKYDNKDFTLEQLNIIHFYQDIIENTLPGTEINENLEHRVIIYPIDKDGNAVLKFYADFGREEFLKEKEVFLKSRNKHYRLKIIENMEVGDKFWEDGEIYKCTEKPVLNNTYYSWKGINFEQEEIEFGVDVEWIERFKLESL